MVSAKKRVFIVHGWGGYPKEGWFPWLKKELIKQKYEVNVLEMPNTVKPKIKEWVNYLSKQVDKLDNNTLFVGHSIGCQTILRYLEKENKKCAGVIFVAPWLTLSNLETKVEINIAKPWVETEIDFNKIKKLKIKFVSIFSDNDPYVPLENIKFFEKKINSDIIVLKNKGHFSGDDKVKKIPEIMDEIKIIFRR